MLISGLFYLAELTNRTGTNIIWVDENEDS